MKKNNFKSFFYGMGGMAAIGNAVAEYSNDNMGMTVFWGAVMLYLLGLSINSAQHDKCAEVKKLQKQLENQKLNNQQKVR